MVLETTIGILAGVCVVAIGMAVTLLVQQRRQLRLARARASAEAYVGSIDDSSESASFESSVRRLGTRLSAGSVSLKLRERLAAAGYHAESAAGTFLGYKVLLALLACILSTAGLLVVELAIPLKITIGAFATGGLLMLPDLVVWLKRQRRRREVQEFLPDAIDLLEICVSAGMGLDMAWNAVADEMRRVNTTLADEMDLTNLEISLGVGRAGALRHMAERTGAGEISSLVALLVQSDRFGASVVAALHTFAESMRETRSARAEEAAEKMAVKMLFPMVMFIFPPLLILMVGPAMVKLIGTIS